MRRDKDIWRIRYKENRKKERKKEEHPEEEKG
jgi:hypothetical protein